MCRAARLRTASRATSKTARNEIRRRRKRKRANSQSISRIRISERYTRGHRLARPSHDRDCNS
jgi:hypothetical protein